MMRFAVILLISVLLPVSARGETDEAVTMETPASAAGYSRMTPGEKVQFYLKSNVDPVSVFAGAFSAGYNQAIDSIPEWGQGMKGYGKRLASSLGRKTIDMTVCSGLKILLWEDPRYFYSERQDIRSRTLHAISETFIAHKDSGGTRPGYTWFVGTVSGVYLSRRWHPENYRTTKNYIQDAVASVGIQSAKNVFMEFWPDIRKKFLKR